MESFMQSTQPHYETGVVISLDGDPEVQER